MRHTIQALVENKFGVLARISSLFSARGYNINSLAVGETNDPSVSCMTIVVNAKDERILEQIKKQLNKLVDVITVSDLTKKDYIDRELLLLKVGSSDGGKKEIQHLVKQFGANVLEEKAEYSIIEFSGDHIRIKELLEECRKKGIRELVRTGKIAIVK